MDEVDKIIIQTLKQIGCTVDSDENDLSSFTPEILVRCVAVCLREIKPSTINLPHSLPAGMAQRFTAATKLAEFCASIGYRNDIGYQTFLYPNPVDVRRLFMFLIEQLPKDNSGQSDADIDSQSSPIGEYELLRKDINAEILRQMKVPWVPQYCRVVANRRLNGCSSQCVPFAPQLNLNIPRAGSQTKEVQKYWQQHAPNVFQQTAEEKYDLISSVLHKNAMDLYTKTDIDLELLKSPLGMLTTFSDSIKKSTPSTTKTESTTTTNESAKMTTTLSPLERLSEDVHELNSQNQLLIGVKQSNQAKINELRNKQKDIANDCEQLLQNAKIHERTCVVLENSDENLIKLENLILTTKERRKGLHQQWQEYRQPMSEHLQTLTNAKQGKNLQNVNELQALIVRLEQSLREKTNNHAQLCSELKSATNSAATPRKDYTHRIMEFIGNIRKQRNDIYRVLDDTRDLQKQLNSVAAQLQRQFNYTDDLLFQSAKHDMHAKKAYKLLASLHGTCNELIELITQTGNITKSIRDLEVQIDRERMKNISASLVQISADITNFETVIRGIQAEIRKVENKITAG